MYRHFVLPISDFITGWSIAKALSFLEESQWWSYEQLVNFQNSRLRMLIDHVYHNVTYYRNIMIDRGLTPDDFSTVEDLNKLPILTKKDVQNNFPENICANNIKPSQYMMGKSSGSTGVPIQYSISKQAYGFNQAANLRGWSWMGYRLGDKIVKVSQNERSSALKKAQDFIDRTRLFSHSYDKQQIMELFNLLTSYRPKFLRSYPDPLEFISDCIIDQGLVLPPVSAINTTGNMLFAETREKIEAVFKTKIFDSYSCEGGANTFECETHQYYHQSMEYAITEILDENGNEVAPGKTGHHYATDLWNWATPLIRYDSGDLLTRGHDCSCGRKLATISRIVGRDNDIIVTPSGDRLVAQSFTTYFKYVKEISQFQVHQLDASTLLFKIVPKLEVSNELVVKITDDWIRRTNNLMSVKVEIHQDLPLLASGKRRFVFTCL